MHKETELRDLVAREVYYNVSMLVSELAQNEKYMDDLLPVCVQDDWAEPAYENGWTVEEDDSSEYYAIKRLVSADDRLGPFATEADAWRAACEQDGLEPYQREAFEHWIVSDWMADKLEAQGEMVTRDFLGLTVWGRATTGQAIYVDGVIERIYADLHKEQS